MLFRMCLKINLGVSYVFISVFLSFSPFLKSTADCPDAVPSSAETGGTNYLAPGGLSGKSRSRMCLAIPEWDTPPAPRPTGDIAGDWRNGGGWMAVCHPSRSGVLTFWCITLDATLVTLGPFSSSR